jgi:uncharacterized membrane protein YeaQ/YmgE (transglycosylase-associated protein family)
MVLFPALALYLLLICLVIASATGALAGVLASLCLRLPMRGIWKDTLLGLLGFLVAFMAFVFLGPLHTFVNSDEGLPLKAGLMMAAVLPFLRELSRFIRTKRARTATEHSPIQ